MKTLKYILKHILALPIYPFFLFVLVSDGLNIFIHWAISFYLNKVKKILK